MIPEEIATETRVVRSKIEKQVEQISQACPIAFPPAYEPPVGTNVYDYSSYEQDWMERLGSSLSTSMGTICIEAVGYHTLRQNLRLVKQQINFIIPQLITCQQGADGLYKSLQKERKEGQRLEKMVAKQNLEIEEMKLLNKGLLKAAFNQKNVTTKLNDTISWLNGERVGEYTEYQQKVDTLEEELRIVYNEKEECLTEKDERIEELISRTQTIEKQLEDEKQKVAMLKQEANIRDQVQIKMAVQQDEETRELHELTKQLSKVKIKAEALEKKNAALVLKLAEQENIMNVDKIQLSAGEGLLGFKKWVKKQSV